MEQDAERGRRERTIWYFAYGANMSPRVLARRGLSSLSSQAGILHGYQLRFSHAGLIPIEPAFANIEPAPNASPDDSPDAPPDAPPNPSIVHGVLHRLPAAHMARLDRIEGAEYRHLHVTVHGRETGPVDARAYLDPYPVRGKIPSRRYLNDLLDGAVHFDLPDDYVRRLRAQPARHVPIISDAVPLFVRAAEHIRRAGFRPERLRLLLRGEWGRADPPAKSRTDEREP